MIAPTLQGTAGDGEVTLTWIAVAGAVKYRVFMDTGPIGKRQTATTLKVPGLTNGVPHGFQVRGVDAAGAQGPLSTPLLPLTPKAPVGFLPVGFGKGTTGGGKDTTHMVDTGN